MPTYEIVVTDVTRYGDLYCVAGWDVLNGVMIRPEPPSANAANEASRFWGSNNAGPNKFFSVGNRVRFDAALPPEAFPFPHATEDRLVLQQPNTAVLGQHTLEEIVQIVQMGVSPTLLQVFDGQLVRANSGKAYVPAETNVPSLGAIEVPPGTIQLYEDNPSGNKRRLRAIIQHAGQGYDLSVTADAAKERFLSDGLPALAADIEGAERLHLRVGLARAFNDAPCYAQVNGIYCL